MMAAASVVPGIGEVDIAEQERIQQLIEQEQKDHELAQRLYREQFENPSPVYHRGQSARSMPYRRRQNQSPAEEQTGTSAPAQPTNNARTAGPIRNRAVTSRGGRAAGRGRGARGRGGVANSSTTSRPHRQNTSEIQWQFVGDRVTMREGDEVIDMTATTYFPDDDDDSDYSQSDEDETVNGTFIISSNSESGSVYDETESGTTAAAGRRNTRGRGRGRGAGAVDRSEVGGQRMRRGGSNARNADNGTLPISNRPSNRHTAPSFSRLRPAVNAFQSYIHSLLQGELMRDDRRRDPLFRITNNDRENDGDDEDNDSYDSDGSAIFDDDDDDVVFINADGPIRADDNHIRQPIFEEDREMYNRELELYHDDDDEFRVPPAKSTSSGRGKYKEPDATWGDCTMCMNTPFKPQGCSKCLQFLGCSDCVTRWYNTRRNSLEGASCPLCRALWHSRPGVQLMPTIEKNRKKTEKNKPVATTSSDAPSTSAAPYSASTSSSSSSRFRKP